MMVLWEKEKINEKYLVDCLNLKSNTLAPLLKKLKEKKYITIDKNTNDKRSINIKITQKGIELKNKAIDIPKIFGKSFPLNQKELSIYKKLICKIISWEIK